MHGHWICSDGVVNGFDTIHFPGFSVFKITVKISEKLLMDPHLIKSKHWGDLMEHPIFSPTNEGTKALTGQGTATPLTQEAAQEDSQ